MPFPFAMEMCGKASLSRIFFSSAVTSSWCHKQCAGGMGLEAVIDFGRGFGQIIVDLLMESGMTSQGRQPSGHSRHPSE